AARHHLGVRTVDGDDTIDSPSPATFGPGNEPAHRAGEASQVARVEVDVAGVVDGAGAVAAGEPERDRNPHVGHPVNDVRGRVDAPAGPRLGADRELNRQPPDDARPETAEHTGSLPDRWQTGTAILGPRACAGGTHPWSGAGSPAAGPVDAAKRVANGAHGSRKR